LIVAVGGVAYAAIPDSEGVIHGCFNKQNGNLRVVESGGACRSSESAIDWNQQGPPGPPGGGVRDLGQIVVAGNDSQVLFSEGPLTVTGQCDLDRVGEIDFALILVSTTQDQVASPNCCK